MRPLFFFFLLLLFPTRALAVEREHHLGAGVGPNLFKVDGSSLYAGGALALHYTYGLSDTFNLLLEGGTSFASLRTEPADAPKNRPGMIHALSGGVGYVLDILSWVPYGGILVGGHALTGGNLDSARVLPGATLALGLDYRVSRKVAAGLALRQHFLFTELGTYPEFSQVFFRLEATWGW